MKLRVTKRLFKTEKAAFDKIINNKTMLISLNVFQVLIQNVFAIRFLTKICSTVKLEKFA